MLNNMKNSEQYLTELMSRVVSKTAQKESIPRKLEDGSLLYRSELHIIDAVGSHPEINLTAIAEVIGVTKGAVSQKVKLLEKKDFIKRYKNPDNRKEVFFELTTKGRLIYEGHREFHRLLNARILSALGGYNQENIEKLIKFFRAIEEHLETI